MKDSNIRPRSLLVLLFGGAFIGCLICGLFFSLGKVEDRIKDVDAKQYSLWVKITHRTDITFEEWKMLPTPFEHMEVYQK